MALAFFEFLLVLGITPETPGVKEGVAQILASHKRWLDQMEQAVQ